MGPLLFIALFALVPPVLLYSPEDEKEYEKKCSPFSCLGGDIRFPYKNATSPPYCGAFAVDGCDKDVQRIQLEKEGKWYQVKRISQGNTIAVIDTEFRELLENKSCQSFNNLTFPNLTYASFHIASMNLTMFKCKKRANISPLKLEFSYTGCKDFNIYYTYQNKSLLRPPPNCSIVQLPANIGENYSNISRLLTASFTLDVGFSPTCYWCSLEGGNCSVTSSGQLVCRGAEKVFGDRNLGMKLGVGLGLGVPAAFALILLIYLYKKHCASSNLISANTSSGPFSKSYTEDSDVCFGVPIFSYAELEEATNNFHSENELGDGGFGTVYYGKLRDGREVAIKRLKENNFKRIKQFMNEIEILTHLGHKNLVLLYGCTSYRSRELLIVYEYIPNGTVADHLHGNLAKSNPLAWPIRMKIAIETASALDYLHASEIIHRDVKTNNILLDKNFCVKVAEFGLSRLFPNDVTHVSTAPQGTPGYVDPEYYHCYQLTDRSDVYSFGVVLIELISSMPAVDVTRHRHEINLASLAINKIQKGALDELIDPCLGSNSSEEVKRMTIAVAELAFLCLQQDKELRPSINEVLEELRGIETGVYKSKYSQVKHNDTEAAKRKVPSSPPPDSSVPLLRKIQPPCSPDSVTHKWVSRSSSTLPGINREDFIRTDSIF